MDTMAQLEEGSDGQMCGSMKGGDLFKTTNWPLMVHFKAKSYSNIIHSSRLIPSIFQMG